MRLLPKRGDLLRAIRIPCRVYPLQRPRFSKQGGVYQPLKNQEELRSLMAREPRLMINRPIIVDSYAYFLPSQRLKWPSTRHWPDEDNARKAILDALQANHIIVDDTLVIGGENWKLFGASECLIVKIYEAVSDQSDIEALGTVTNQMSEAAA